jgi:hypothetical protein
MIENRKKRKNAFVAGPDALAGSEVAHRAIRPTPRTCST